MNKYENRFRDEGKCNVQCKETHSKIYFTLTFSQVIYIRHCGCPTELSDYKIVWWLVGMYGVQGLHPLWVKHGDWLC